MNIEKLMEKLPEGYEKTCYETGAMKRAREIKRPRDLMMLALSYVSQNFSLMEMSEIARLKGIGNISDVGFMKRFSKCNEWFVNILKQIEVEEVANYKKPEKLSKYKFKAIDASDVTSKGAVKSRYRLHYAINLFTMSSDEYKITNQKTGESLTNFTIAPDDLVIADRGYGTKKSIEYCLESKGDFILRIRNNPFKLYDESQEEVHIIDFLEGITEDEAKEVLVYMESSKKEKIPLRLCIIKKPPETKENTSRIIKTYERTHQRKLSEETKRAHEYFFVLSSLPKELASAKEILEIYRLRWQVELYFKRLKSIMDFGDLPIKNEQSIKAWLSGKLIFALLIEKMIASVDFSPYGEAAE